VIKKSALGLPLVVSVLLLSACGSSKEGAVDAGKAPVASQAPPVREMQPLQPGQPPQKPDKSLIPQGPVVPAGKPGTTAMPFNQGFQLADLEYHFIGAKGKGFVGLEANPALKPTDGNNYFIVRYVVIDHGKSVVVPNTAAVHLMNETTRQVIDIDQAATNANVQSGAATGLPDQLALEPEQPQVQTLAFQLPTSTDPTKLSLLVTEPSDPTHVFQLVKLSN
jgi:hypothetical protein